MTPINGYRTTKSNDQEDDRTLIQQVGMGDRKAFSILYDRYKALVFSLAIKIAVSHETAEDIALDAFTQIWKNADKYHPEKGSVKGWIASIARYRSIDTLRRRKVRQDINRPRWSDVQLEKLPSNDNPSEAFELKVTKCISAVVFREALVPHIGFAAVCWGDYAWAEGFNPKIKLVRDRTLMEGDIYCNHRYIWTG